MTEKELEKVLINYCENNNIDFAYEKGVAIFRLLIELHAKDFVNTDIIIDIKNNCIVNIMPNDWIVTKYSDINDFKRISIVHIIRSEILKELLK
jgi:hypothetical protein